MVAVPRSRLPSWPAASVRIQMAEFWEQYACAHEAGNNREALATIPRNRGGTFLFGGIFGGTGRRPNLINRALSQPAAVSSIPSLPLIRTKRLTHAVGLFCIQGAGFQAVWQRL